MKRRTLWLALGLAGGLLLARHLGCVGLNSGFVRSTDDSRFGSAEEPLSDLHEGQPSPAGDAGTGVVVVDTTSTRLGGLVQQWAQRSIAKQLPAGVAGTRVVILSLDLSSPLNMPLYKSGTYTLAAVATVREPKDSGSASRTFRIKFGGEIEAWGPMTTSWAEDQLGSHIAGYLTTRVVAGASSGG